VQGLLVKLGAKGEKHRLFMRKRHAVRLRRVALNLSDEPFLVRGAGLEPAVAMKHLVHDSSPRR